MPGGQQGVCLVKWLHTAASRGPTVLSQSSENVPDPPERKGQLTPNMLSLVINETINVTMQIKLKQLILCDFL